MNKRMFEKSLVQTLSQFNRQLTTEEKKQVRRVYLDYLNAVLCPKRTELLDINDMKQRNGEHLSNMTCFTMESIGIEHGYKRALISAFGESTYPFDVELDNRSGKGERFNPNRLAWMMGYVGIRPSRSLVSALTAILETQFKGEELSGLCCQLNTQTRGELASIFMHLGLDEDYPFGRDLYGCGLLDPVRVTFALSLVILGSWANGIPVPYSGTFGWLKFAKAHVDVLDRFADYIAKDKVPARVFKFKAIERVWGTNEKEILDLYEAKKPAYSVSLREPKKPFFLFNKAQPLWARIIVVYWLLVFAWLAGVAGHHVDASLIEPHLGHTIAH